MYEQLASQIQIPPPPAPVAVTLDPATTALLVLDITETTCAPQPNCREMLPRLAGLVAKARAAGLFIAYTTGASPSPLLPEVDALPGDPVITSGQNKFFGSALDDLLKARGIRTLILAGWRTNGSVTYTSHGATVLGYTVVVPVDGTAAAAPFQVAIGLYQVLNLLNGNPDNQPLKPGAVTLSRSDLITFAASGAPA